MDLTREEKELLLKTARASISAGISGVKLPVRQMESEILKQKMGAFVTLKKGGQLRGCIGFIKGVKPLCETIAEMAHAAAFDDPRFGPVQADELKDLDIEISALSPLKQVSDVMEIEVEKHGIYMVNGFQSGLLLPQVATEYGWDRETFLRETCHKAGLPGNAWKDPETQIFIFSATVFSED